MKKNYVTSKWHLYDIYVILTPNDAERTDLVVCMSKLCSRLYSQTKNNKTIKQQNNTASDQTRGQHSQFLQQRWRRRINVSQGQGHHKSSSQLHNGQLHLLNFRRQIYFYIRLYITLHFTLHFTWHLLTTIKQQYSCNYHMFCRFKPHQYYILSQTFTQTQQALTQN